jgi:hypothetical protein
MKKLCADQRKGVVTKLVALFDGLLPQDIDDVVTQAKAEASVQTLEDRKRSLGKLFDSHMETLEFRGCPKVIIDEIFQNKRDEVLSKAVAMEIPEGHIPFMPVIPRSYLGIYGLMPMVRNGDKVGFTHLDPNGITDSKETPKYPYFIYDVEDGTDTLGKTPECAEQLIKAQNRLCHIPDEDIALCVHTDVLSRHHLWSTGSRYRHADYVPNVYLFDGKPRLHCRYRYGSGSGWGSASCRSRA